MAISLRKAGLADCQELYDMQIKSFAALLEKYQDYDYSPGAEKIEKTEKRLKEVNSDYYFICLGNVHIGAIRIIKQDNLCRLKQIYILPEYQNKGHAQQAILVAESLYPKVSRWELDTIKQEGKLCHLYEKMGYKQTGHEETIKEGMTLVFYAKDLGQKANMPTRSQIIDVLKKSLEPLPFIYALWLEGADASDTVDEYSDIDLWIDFEDDHEREVYSVVENALSGIGMIDFKYIMKHRHPKIRQRIYHLADTSKYLMIDVCWQLHSRDKAESTVISGDKLEAACVLFDKTGVLSFADYDAAQAVRQRQEIIDTCTYQYSQHVRVDKYIRRGCFLEAYAAYHEYVFEPLVALVRLMHTPMHPKAYLMHISRDTPDDKRQELEYFATIGSLDEMERKEHESEAWFQNLLGELE
jgi:hypothetical protein